MIEYWKNLSLENLFYINDNGLVCEEDWKDVPDWENIYQASNLGRLRSVERHIVYSNNAVRRVKGVVLKQAKGKKYLQICLYRNQKATNYVVHQLVYSAFYGYYPKKGSGKVIDHIDTKQKTNNCLWNLQILTHRRNTVKYIRTSKYLLGVHVSSSRFYSIIHYNGKNRHLGMFDTEQEAHEMYNKAVSLVEKNESIYHLIKSFKRSPSGEQNIYIRNGKFEVRVLINGKPKRFGAHNSLDEAIVIRDMALSKAS